MKKNKTTSTIKLKKWDFLSLILTFGDLHYRLAKTENAEIKESLHNAIQNIWKKVVEHSALITNKRGKR